MMWIGVSTLKLGQRRDCTTTCNFKDLYNYSPQIESFYPSEYISKDMWELSLDKYLVTKYNIGKKYN